MASKVKAVKAWAEVCNLNGKILRVVFGNKPEKVILDHYDHDYDWVRVEIREIQPRKKAVVRLKRGTA